MLMIINFLQQTVSLAKIYLTLVISVKMTALIGGHSLKSHRTNQNNVVSSRRNIPSTWLVMALRDT